MKKTYILGIDADATKIGVCIIDAISGAVIASDKFISIHHFFAQISDLRTQLKVFIKRFHNPYNDQHIKLAVIEDYGWHPVQRFATSKGELMGLIKNMLVREEIPRLRWLSTTTKKKKTFTEECMVSPSQLTKFIFGSGRTPKTGKSSRLMLYVYKSTGYEFQTDDECDAFMLAMAGRIFIRCYRSGLQECLAIPLLGPNGKKRVFQINKDQFDPIKKWLLNYCGRSM